MKKGFTLVEIVAVIVIVGTIILLVTPLVIGTVNKSKDNAKIQSARSYIKAVKASISNIELGDKQIVDGTYNIMENGGICLGTLIDGYCDSDVLNVLADGDKPVYGKLTLIKGNIEQLSLIFKDDKTVVQDNNGNLVFGILPDELLKPGLHDENNNIIYTWEELIKKKIIKVTDGALAKDTNKKLLVGKLAVDESVTSIAGSGFKDCPDLTAIFIPNSVTSIGTYAFHGCENLSHITLPDSITSIGENTFRGFYGLKTITLPETLTSIGGSAFHSCTNLISITIPNSVTSIKGSAFFGCTNLKEVTLNIGIKTFGTYVFHGCTSLDTINYKGTQTQWNSISKGSYWNNNTASNLKINYNYVD